MAIRDRGNSANCGRFEWEYHIIFTETYWNEQTNVLNTIKRVFETSIRGISLVVFHFCWKIYLPTQNAMWIDMIRLPAFWFLDKNWQAAGHLCKYKGLSQNNTSEKYIQRMLIFRSYSSTLGKSLLMFKQSWN